MAVPPFAIRLATWAALPLAAIGATSQPTTIPADLQPWVERLNDVDPTERLAAQVHLMTVGTRAVPALTAAMDDPRPEVSIRAQQALRQIRLFTLRTGANLDPALALANQYLATDRRSTREAIVQQLAALRPAPTDVLVRLFLLEPDATLRARLLANAGPAYRQAIPRLIAEGDGAALPLLLEQSAAELSYLGAPDYAVERQRTGHWDDAITQWRAELANGDPPHQALAAGVLCYLYRVVGKSNDATEMAKRSGDWRLILATALDRDDWTAAATASNGWPNGKGGALRAALNTLAGAATDSVARTLSGDDAYAADAESIGVGKIHLLLGDVDGGLAKLSELPTQGGDPVAAFRIRQARGEYDAALAIAIRFSADPKVGSSLIKLRDDLRRLLGELPDGPTTAVRKPTHADPAWTKAVTDLAAHRYGEAAAGLAAGERDPNRLDWWYVRGFALDAAGDAERGRSLMAAATLAPLGDASARAELANHLSAAGLDDAAAEQRSLAIRVANPFYDYPALLDVNLAREATATAGHDYATAVAAAERVWLFSFWPAQTWDGPLPYLTVPADVHLARARLSRSKDDWPGAMRELETYRTFLPTSTDLPLEWVPLLDAHGDHAGADAMFAIAYDALDAQSKRHPPSTYLHNQPAWLAACCCRRLDAGLAHAESAVQIAPDDWGLIDTLAEVHFRMGNRAAATELERRAAALPGADAAYAARQLVRFAKAEVPSTTRPVDAPN